MVESTICYELTDKQIVIGMLDDDNFLLEPRYVRETFIDDQMHVSFHKLNYYINNDFGVKITKDKIFYKFLPTEQLINTYFRILHEEYIGRDIIENEDGSVHVDSDIDSKLVSTTKN